MIITPWKCNQSSHVSYLPVYNSYYRQRTGKRMELIISNCTRWSTCMDFPTTGMQKSGEICSLYNSNPAKPAEVWCLELYAETLFVLLLKFGAVLSNICGFMMEVSCWRRILQCVIVRSFLRLIKLRKLAVCKLDLLRVGFTRCHGVLDHGLNLKD